jgi:hypothetical protein
MRRLFYNSFGCAFSSASEVILSRSDVLHAALYHIGFNRLVFCILLEVLSMSTGKQDSMEQENLGCCRSYAHALPATKPHAVSTLNQVGTVGSERNGRGEGSFTSWAK